MEHRRGGGRGRGRGRPGAENSKMGRDQMLMTMTKKTTTPSSYCFFKIMLEDFRQFLFVPPKFASTIGGLISRELYLRDANGHSWKVKLSRKDGYLVFRDGWREFVLDHSIAFGELVVFEYRRNSVFSVKIFGTDACERTYQFTERYRVKVIREKRKVSEVKSKHIVVSKRSKTTCEASKCNWQHGNFDSLENVRREMISSGTLEIASGKSREVSCDVVRGDLKLLEPELETEGRYEDSLLRTYTPRRADDEDDLRKLTLVNEEYYKFLLTTTGIRYIYDEDMKHQLEPSMLTANNMLLCEKENQEDNAAMPCIPIVEPTLDHKRCENGNRKFKKTSKKFRGRAAAHISRVEPDRKNKNPVIMKEHFEQSGRVPDVLSKDVNEKHAPFPKGNVNPVKLETVDLKYIASRAPAKFRISVPISAQTSWLALPGRLSSNGGGLRLQRKVIVLRDPCMRLWPMLYHEGLDFSGFVDGWEPFATANNIRKGHVCEFEQVADGSEFTLQVHIS